MLHKFITRVPFKQDKGKLKKIGIFLKKRYYDVYQTQKCTGSAMVQEVKQSKINCWKGWSLAMSDTCKHSADHVSASKVHAISQGATHLGIFYGYARALMTYSLLTDICCCWRGRNEERRSPEKSKKPIKTPSTIWRFHMRQPCKLVEIALLPSETYWKVEYALDFTSIFWHWNIFNLCFREAVYLCRNNKIVNWFKMYWSL